jgi:hypothetical protein
VSVLVAGNAPCRNILLYHVKWSSVLFRIIWYDFVVSSMNIFIIFANGQVEGYSNINNKKFAQHKRQKLGS